jgi:cell division protein FtsW (lipid II flippase)
MSRADRNHIDLSMLIAVLILMLLSLGIVYSASSTYAQAKYGESEHMLANHAIKVLLGVLALFIGMRIDYHHLQKVTKPALLISGSALLLFTLSSAARQKERRDG